MGGEGWSEGRSEYCRVSPAKPADLISSWKLSFSFATTEGREAKRAHLTNRVCFKWIRYDTRSQKNCYELVEVQERTIHMHN